MAFIAARASAAARAVSTMLNLRARCTSISPFRAFSTTGSEFFKSNDPELHEEGVHKMKVNKDGWGGGEIVFSDRDLPPEGLRHNKALIVSVQINGITIPEVLVDTGAAFNLCTLETLNALGNSVRYLWPERGGVTGCLRGSSQWKLGSFVALCDVGEVKSLVQIVVVDKCSCKMVLGRPWLHRLGAVSSTAHQKIKLFYRGRMITIHGEDYA